MIEAGSKLYHFAYGAMTVTSVSYSKNGDCVYTVADDPAGYRNTECSYTPVQIWLLDTVGHWVFENSWEVGTENNDFDWKSIWPGYEKAPEAPVMFAKERKNWHKCFGEY